MRDRTYFAIYFGCSVTALGVHGCMALLGNEIGTACFFTLIGGLMCGHGMTHYWRAMK